LLHLILRSRACAASRRMATKRQLGRVGKGALAPCPPFTTCSARWARFALPTLRISQTHALILTARFSPELCKFFAPSWTEGAGKAGRRLRPQRRVQKLGNSAHGFDRYSRDIPAFPAQWFYGLYVLSPGKRPFLPPLPAEIIHRRSARVAAPGPHDFTVRCFPSPGGRTLIPFENQAVTPEIAAAIASCAQRIVTIAKRPSSGRGTRIDTVNQNSGKEKYF
jgi:hypothetical protein